MTVFVLLVAAGALIAILRSKWRFFVQWLTGVRGRDWPVVSATVDLVDVIEQRGGKRGEIVGHLATLTYIYRNPDLQTGEYCREFGADDGDDAAAWAASYKGSTVRVHVDPRDPTHSVLRKEDL